MTENGDEMGGEGVGGSGRAEGERDRQTECGEL